MHMQDRSFAPEAPYKLEALGKQQQTAASGNAQPGMTMCKSWRDRIASPHISLQLWSHKSSAELQPACLTLYCNEFYFYTGCTTALQVKGRKKATSLKKGRKMRRLLFRSKRSPSAGGLFMAARICPRSEIYD
ncbi:MAG: hypothetical protein Q4G66_10135 [bacterium]|nr:hypothetical protein [bacterium]